MFTRIRLLSLRWAVLALAWAVSGATSSALPIDDFAVLAGRTFRVYGDVSEAVRSPSALGSVLSVEIPFGVPNGRIQYGGTGGKGVTVAANPLIPMMFRFTWDGESAVGVTSGAGLGCLNLTAEGASAFVLRELKFQQACDGKVVGCPMLEIQLRVFDGTDPTGQRYSTGVVRRRVTNQMRDLVIPFAQLARPGPEGPWRPSCVGAVTATFLVPPKVESTVSFLKIETNGSCTKLTRGGRPDCDELREDSARVPVTIDFDDQDSVTAPPPTPATFGTPSTDATPKIVLTIPAAVRAAREELFEADEITPTPSKMTAVPTAIPAVEVPVPVDPKGMQDEQTFGAVAG
jgi:hypothetical protein